METTLYIIVPCYNEEEVLPVTSPLFLEALESMIRKKIAGEKSRILYVDDGSCDRTWNLIASYMEESSYVQGIRLKQNCGHQKALWSGLMEAKDRADITITIDCDGQDDIRAMEEMAVAYQKGNEVVYGVRSDRRTDSFLKRTSAQLFYKLMNLLGAKLVYNHADYRLLSSRVIRELETFEAKDLFLRGMVPHVEAKKAIVYYERQERIAGDTKYSFWKMCGLAWRGFRNHNAMTYRNRKR